jgi:hypothetical protein
MAISVQHGPSMVDYGMAVAKAAEKTEAANRSQQYGNYLAGVQQANQSYGLGLGNLAVAQDKTSIERDRTALDSRKLDIDEFLAQIEKQKVEYNMKQGIDATKADLYNAIANRESSYAQLMGGHERLYGGGGYSYIR